MPRTRCRTPTSSPRPSWRAARSGPAPPMAVCGGPERVLPPTACPRARPPRRRGGRGDLRRPGHGAEPQRQELRDLVVDALAGLNPSDREVIELNLRHVLDGQDLADVLGVSRNQAYALLSRARAQFEGSLGALLVARPAAGTARNLRASSGTGTGSSTILLRKRVQPAHRGLRGVRQPQRRELSPAMLLSLLPIVALPACCGSRCSAWWTSSPVAAGHRELVAHRAEPFDRSGFPKPVAAPRRVYGVQALTAPRAWRPRRPSCSAPAPSSRWTRCTARARRRRPRRPSARPPSATHPDVRAERGSPLSAAHKSGGKNPGLTITVSASPTPSALAAIVPPGGGAAAARTHPPVHAACQPDADTAAAVTRHAGGLGELGDADPEFRGEPQRRVHAHRAGWRAVSGYSIENPSSGLSVSPTSGSLSSGQSVTISLSASSVSVLAGETDLSVSPGGLSVAVFPPSS